MVLYACSTNRGKLQEFALAAQTAGVPNISLEILPGLNEIPPPEETGTSFEANAVLKATYYSRFTQEIVVADDSGLEASALGGAPGIHSARFAGRDATDAANNELLLNRLHNTANRAARFVCVLALARSGRVLTLAEGTAEGEILTSPRGKNGFGYDPLFFYNPLNRSFAELLPAEKLSVSHRGNALRNLFAQISAIS